MTGGCIMSGSLLVYPDLATLFLASDSSAWLTGLTVDVAGGRISL